MDKTDLKILYITQKVDYQDDLLGAVHAYIASLAKQAERLYVVCLFKGEARLPANCQVFSLGKEKDLALSMAILNLKLVAGSPPDLAATEMMLASLVKLADLLASMVAFFLLVVAHLECPDIWLRGYIALYSSPFSF